MCAFTIIWSNKNVGNLELILQLRNVAMLKDILCSVVVFNGGCQMRSVDKCTQRHFIQDTDPYDHFQQKRP